MSKLLNIAIHHRKDSFSEYWINYCKKNNIDYTLVNCYSSDIINQIKECDALMYNWVFWHSRDILIAKQLVNSVEKMGIQVYPNLNTCLYYDDKLGQKYLAESLGLPLVKSDAFFYKQDAYKWIEFAKLPIVFKLRGGASSVNVKLVKTKIYAKKLIRKSFSRGFGSKDMVAIFKDRLSKAKKEPNIKTIIYALKGLARIFISNDHEKLSSREKGYIYFQEFIPGCTYDIRVVIVGKRAFAIKRFTRNNDFRASGSGIKEYEPSAINIECIKLAFELNKKLKMQSVAFDFVEGKEGIQLIEFSYTWATDSFGKQPGYWDDNLNWVDGYFCPADFIIEDIVKNIKNKIK